MLLLVVRFHSILKESKLMRMSNLVGKDLPIELRKCAVEMRKDLVFDAAQKDLMTG
jgi:hypothetical protein